METISSSDLIKGFKEKSKAKELSTTPAPHTKAQTYSPRGTQGKGTRPNQPSRRMDPTQSVENTTPYPMVAINALRNLGGRPRKWKSPDEIWQLGLEYFEKAVEAKEPLTISGLCCYLGTWLKMLTDYEMGVHTGANGDNRGFSGPIKLLRIICANYAENHGYHARNPAFAIFALKQHGWSDIVKIEQSVSVIHALDKATLAVVEGYIKSLEQRIMSDDEDLDVIDVIPEPANYAMLMPALDK